MQLWHEQSHRYHTEMLDFKKLTTEAVDGLRTEHSMMLKDLDGAAARVDRVEREMDYVETQTSPRACANKADKVVEQGAWGLEESRGEEEEEEDWEELHSRVSGELRGSTYTLKPKVLCGMAAFDLCFLIHDGALAQSGPMGYVVCSVVNFSTPGSITHHPFCIIAVLEKPWHWKMGDKHSAVTSHLMEWFESVGSHVFQEKCGLMQLIYFCRATPLLALFEHSVCLYNLQIPRRAATNNAEI